MISNTVMVNVTTYSDITISYLYVPGEYQGWNPGGAPKLWSTNGFIYEGYIWVPGGGTRKFKFTSAPNWGGVNYGFNGNPGELSTDGGASDLDLPANENGQLYLLRVNTTALTWSATATDWGVIGSATPGGWDNSTPMDYDPATGLLTAQVAMTAGAFKFRANNDWGINLGGSPVGDPYLDYGGNDLNNSTAGTVIVVLDLRTPAVNTPPTPFKYKYSIQ